MSDENKSKSFGKVDEAVVSLSQAILSPLDALFKAQAHAARSFLNLIMQIGYPHSPSTGQPDSAGGTQNAPGNNENPQPGKPFILDFAYTATGGSGLPEEHKISIPALSLVPLNSLAIDSAEFKFGLNIQEVHEHQQVQETRTKDSGTQKRDWFLVKEPVSLQGHIASNSTGKQSSQSMTTIDISVKVSKAPMTSALDKLLTTLTQSASISPLNKTN